jgi:hypothetical protein
MDLGGMSASHPVGS